MPRYGHCRRPASVCRNRQRDVVVVARQQSVQIGRAATDVLLRRERVAHASSVAVPASAASGLGPGAGDGAGIAVALRLHHTASRSASMLCRAPARASISPISAGVSGEEPVARVPARPEVERVARRLEWWRGRSGICSPATRSWPQPRCSSHPAPRPGRQHCRARQGIDKAAPDRPPPRAARSPVRSHCAA